MQTPKTPRRLPFVRLPDPLRHFSRDGPWFRIAALFIWKLPNIVMAGVFAVALATVKGWW